MFKLKIAKIFGYLGGGLILVAFLSDAISGIYRIVTGEYFFDPYSYIYYTGWLLIGGVAAMGITILLDPENKSQFFKS